MISMTGFAARRGAGLGYGWTWDLRSVNGKGLDLRLRLPDWIDGLELAVRAELQKALTRGNVSLTLKVGAGRRRRGPGLPAEPRPAVGGSGGPGGGGAIAAMTAGLTLRQPTAADVLTLRGVLDQTAAGSRTPAPCGLRSWPTCPPFWPISRRCARAKGAALAAVLTAQIDRIAALTAMPQREAAARSATQAETLREARCPGPGAVTDGVDEAGWRRSWRCSPSRPT